MQRYFQYSSLIVLLLAGSLQAQRQENPETQKVELKVNLNSLELVWNGDQGDGGRGRGEVYISLWISWGEKVLEGLDPQNHEIGPLNGDVEYPSGRIVQDEQTNEYRVIPHEVKDKSFGQIFHAKADCEVVDTLLVDVLVWDEDSGTDLTGFEEIVGEGVRLGKARGFSGAGLVGEVVKFLIDKLTASRDDPLGRFVGFVEIEDPCEENFNIIRELPLENLAADLWKDVNAEGLNEQGSAVPFRNRGIEPPANIGTLRLRILGRKLGKNTSSLAFNPDASLDTELAVVDIGQTDECTLGGLIATGAPIPEAAAPVTYSLYLDVDNDPLTGSLQLASQGAEFEVRLSREDPESFEPRLLAYDFFTDQFVFQPGGIHDFTRNIDDRFFQVAIPLALLDPVVVSSSRPAVLQAMLAGWGVVRDQGGILDMLPLQPSLSAPAITRSFDPTGVAPVVVTTFPRHDAIDVDRSTPICATFSKTMTRESVENAFFLNPPVAGSYSWQGNRICFQPDDPLEPLTQYRVDICPDAVDCAGTPLEGLPDDVSVAALVTCFNWSFVTDSLGLETCSQASPGTQKRLYSEGEDLLVRGEDLPPNSSLDLYLTRHDRTRLVEGAELGPMSILGPVQASTDSVGALASVFMGSLEQPGEFNVVADLDRDGRYQPLNDRLDRKGIGVAVAEPRGGPWFAPQIGNGSQGRIGFQTSQILANTRTATTARLEYRDPTGALLPIPFEDAPASQLEIFLPPGHSRTLTSTSEGALQAGYTRILGAGGLGSITVLSRLFLDLPGSQPAVNTAAGVVLYEAGVPAVRPTRDFSVVLDSRQEKDTGLALLHPGAPGDENAEVTLRLYDQNFGLLDTRLLSLAPGEHLARFVHELFEDSAEAAAEMLGSVTVESSLPLAAVTLRQRDKPGLDYPDEVPTLATFPVLPGRADLLPTEESPRPRGLDPQQVFFFPHMGDGVVGNIRFQTSLIFLNTRNLGVGRQTPLQIEFFSSDGNPSEVELIGQGSATSFQFSLAAGAALALQTAGTGPIQAGYAKITTGSSVGGTAIFTRSEADSGIIVYEAGVPATVPLQDFSVVVDTRAERDTGLALVHPVLSGPAGSPESAQVTMRLYDSGYQLLGEESLALEPGEHRPRFISQFFDSISAQVEDLQGLVTVTSDRPLAVVTLRQRDDPAAPFPEDVPNLTTFPVLAGRPDAEVP